MKVLYKRLKNLGYLLSTKETAYETASPAGIPASLKNWIHSEVAADKQKHRAQCTTTIITTIIIIP